MKLASCTMQGRTTYGVVVNNDLQIPSDEFLKYHPDLKSVLAAGATQELLSAVGERVALDKLSFEPPVTHPEKILAVGMNYMMHIKEMGREPPAYPAVFIRYPDSLVGHGQRLVRPRVSEQYDYEGELAVIIGKPARYVAAAEALSYVAGSLLPAKIFHAAVLAGHGW
jgi:2-keto-4-pentenoate hydratase/2-oxohepta-3-ene-1,7-dioic acid hydratase in catechol pathway